MRESEGSDEPSPYPSSAVTRGLRSAFFFQAEDGIRDLTVTGVQTCALPILPKRHREPTPFAGLTTKPPCDARSEEHTSELQSQSNIVCRLLLEKKKNNIQLIPEPTRQHTIQTRMLLTYSKTILISATSARHF